MKQYADCFLSIIIVQIIITVCANKDSYGPKNTYEDKQIQPGMVEGPKDTYEEKEIQPGKIEGPKETYEGPKDTYEEKEIQPGKIEGPKNTYESPKDTYEEPAVQGGAVGPKDTYENKGPSEGYDPYDSNEDLENILEDPSVQGGNLDNKEDKEGPQKSYDQETTNGPEPYKHEKMKWEPCAYGDTKGLVDMNQKDPQCDNLENWADWDGNEEAYTCLEEEAMEHKKIRKELKDRAIFHLTYDLDCKHFQARHYCACEAIGPHNNPTYHSHIPTCHDHRPVWAKFGEYKYLPVQRWGHDMEHGALHMLYHPCANKKQVDYLRKLVTGCVRKHIITPYKNLTLEKPFALAAWGVKLEMSQVKEDHPPTLHEITNFIRKYANSPAATEGFLSKDGKFTEGLIKAAEIPDGSDIEDKKLCPNMPDMTPQHYRDGLEKWNRTIATAGDAERKKREEAAGLVAPGSYQAGGNKKEAEPEPEAESEPEHEPTPKSYGRKRKSGKFNMNTKGKRSG